MCNVEIRQAAKLAGVKHWQIAEALGIAETTLCVKLRRELPDAERDRVLNVIAELGKEVTE